MKKHYSKRKKVVIDIIDGKIINDTKALKIDNIEIYLEKNGIKILKVISLFLLNIFMINSVKAYQVTDLDLTQTTNIYLLIFFAIIGIIIMWYGHVSRISQLYYIGCILETIIGLILSVNHFNIILSAIYMIVSLYLVFFGG